MAVNTVQASADSWYALVDGDSTLWGNGKGNRVLVGRHFGSWQNRAAFRYPRGTLFNGVPNVNSITAGRLKFRVGPSGCSDLGGAVRFFAERAVTAMAENAEKGTCFVTSAGSSPAARWPGPGRTTSNRAFYSGSPSLGDWITVDATALLKWWYSNPDVTELTVVLVAADATGTSYAETTPGARVMLHTIQSSGSEPFAEIEFNAEVAPNAPTQMTPTGGVPDPTANANSIRVTARHTHPEGKISTQYQVQVFPDSATDATPGASVLDTGAVTASTAHNALRSHGMGPLTPRTFYKWRMRFARLGLWGPWCPLQRTKTAYQPGLPAQLYVTPNTLTPEFFASLISNDSADHITAAQVIVEQVPAAGSIVQKWDSGKKAEGGTRAQVEYGGSSLSYGTEYRWRIRLWNRDDVPTEETGNTTFTQVEQIGPNVTPGDRSTKQNTREVTFTLTRPGGGNIDQIRFRAKNELGTTVLWDSGVVSFTAAASRNVTVPAGVWGWGTEPQFDAAIRNAGDANIGPFSENRTIRINAAPGAPYPLSVVTTGAVFREGAGPDGGDLWVAPSTQPTIRLPFVDRDKELGYTEAPTRREIELRDLADAHLGASPYIITTGITEEWQVPAALLTAGTTYKIRARYDDNANVRSAWSDDLYVKASTAPAVAVTAPAADSVVTAPRPVVTHTFSGTTAQHTRRVVLTEIRNRFSEAALALSPAAYWRLGDASGPFTDEIADRDLTVTGAPTRQVQGALRGDPNGAATFSGSGQYAVGPGTLPAPATSISLMVMFKTADTTAAARGIFARRSGTTENSWAVLLNSTHRVQVQLYQGSTTGHVSATGVNARNDGNWHMVIATFDGTTLRLYVDGAESATSTVLSGTWHKASTAGTSVAAINAAGSTQFPGSVDEAAVFHDRVLTPTEVSDLWALVSDVEELDPIYDTGAEVTTDTEHRLPAFLLPDDTAIGVRVTATDEDRLETTSARSIFSTHFTVPPALTGLVIEPDPDNLALAVSWDASTDPNFDTYLVEARDRFGQWQRVTEISDIAQSSVLYNAVDHNRSTLIRVRQSNGFAYSDPLENTGLLELDGYYALDPRDGSWRELRYVKVGGYSERPDVEQHVYQPVGADGDVVITGSDYGVKVTLRLFRSPEDDDVLDVLRTQHRTGTAVLLKTPSLGTHRVQWRDVPSTDAQAEYHDIDLSATKVRSAA